MAFPEIVHRLMAILHFNPHSEHSRMRKPSLRVVEYKHSATHPYVIEGYRINGKRRRLFFRTKSDAQAELKRIKIKQWPGGEAGLAISDALRAEAVEAQQKLNTGRPQRGRV
jgi:hypothetical protein